MKTCLRCGGPKVRSGKKGHKCPACTRLTDSRRKAARRHADCLPRPPGHEERILDLMARAARGLPLKD